MATVLQYYGLKPDKHNRICCPFHDDKTPGMQVYYKTQTAYCFIANCKTHGKSLDVIDFIMLSEAKSRKAGHNTAEDKHNAILKAADALYDDYKTDKELTAFTNIDFVDFYEAK